MYKSFCLYLLLFVSASGFCQQDFYQKLAEAAGTLPRLVIYDPSYTKIDYPGGDVPAHKGVCSDVIIRTYRKLGIDLQKEVHEDMKQNFALYPKIWGLKSTDRNIDHRRVPNLMTFFSRHGTVLKKSTEAKDYQPGDIVAWDLGRGITHIGMVSNQKAGSGRYQIMHNIGSGQVLEDMLFDFKIIGHYRYPKRH